MPLSACVIKHSAFVQRVGYDMVGVATEPFDLIATVNDDIGGHWNTAYCELDSPDFTQAAASTGEWRRFDDEQVDIAVRLA